MGNRFVFYILIAVATLFIMFGLLFLIASMHNPARMHIAMISGFIGAALMYFSFSAIARINFNSPENLEPLILKIAGKSNGYFSAEDVMARLNITEKTFNAALDSLLVKGLAVQENRDGTVVYKAASAGGLEVRRKCEFCGKEYNVRDSVTTCPACGGSVKMG